MQFIQDSDIPELEPRFSNSWIVTRKDTGKAVLETHSRNTLKKYYRDKVNIETCYQYLCWVNREIREGSTLYNS